MDFCLHQYLTFVNKKQWDLSSRKCSKMPSQCNGINKSPNGHKYLTWFPLRWLSTPPGHPEWRWAPVLPCHEQCYPSLRPEKVVVQYTSQGCCWISCGMLQYNEWIFFLTWELELKANLARAHALERSMSSRKKGKASLEVRTEPSTGVFNRDADKKGQCAECPYLRPVSSLSRKWMTTVLNTKLENMVKRPAMPAREEMRCILPISSRTSEHLLPLQPQDPWYFSHLRLLIKIYILPNIYLDPSCLKFWNWK